MRTAVALLAASLLVLTGCGGDSKAAPTATAPRGGPTATPVRGSATPTVVRQGIVNPAPSGPDRDCPSFRTQAEAQRFFEQQGGPPLDPHRLDSDGDGIACETLPRS